MPSEVSPAFSFYARDFLVGTVALSLAEVGAYIRLLAYQWDHGSVPGEHAALARICGCAEGQMNKLWAALSQKFPRGADGANRNPRLEVERQKQAARRAAVVENGKKGGRPRILGETNRFTKDKAK